jgi:hypothetical protein
MALLTRTKITWTAQSSVSTRPPSTTASRGRRYGNQKPGTRNRMPVHPGNRNPKLPDLTPLTTGAPRD